MVDYQTISIVLTGIGMIIALTYYSLQIRNQNKTRQNQLFMNLYQVYRSKEFRTIYNRILFEWEWTDYEEYWSKYGSSNLEDFTDSSTVVAYFEGIGYLVKSGELGIDSVYGLLGRPILNMYEKFEKESAVYSESVGYQIYPYFKYLYERTVKYMVEHPELKT